MAKNQQDNRIVILEPDSLDRFDEKELVYEDIPFITDLYSDRELTAKSMSAGDYCGTLIYVHDVTLTKVDGERGQFDMCIMYVSVPEAQEIGVMNSASWQVTQVVKGLITQGAWKPCFVAFIEEPSGKGNPTYRFATKDEMAQFVIKK